MFIAFIIPLILVALYIGKFLFIPLFFSFFIFILLRSSSEKINERITSKSKFGNNFSFMLVCSILVVFFYVLGVLIEKNIVNVISQSQMYQANFDKVLNYIERHNFKPLMSLFENILSNINFNSIFSNILSILTNIAGNFSLILIILIFFLLEEKFLIVKFKKLNPEKSFKNIFVKIKNEIYNYFQIKLMTSFLTGILSFIILFLFSSDLSIFFGILAFLLNFIPFIGSLIAVILPFIFSLIQKLDLFNSSILFAILLISQIFVGNFIEPKLMGKSLNLSPLIMLLTLSVMGKLWGLSGMFLSVPILVILLIIFGNFKKTRKIAVFMSEKGNIS
tara:strand:+ start:127 stop:1128 length:1002 start_codon:yes stop_codon:yes gene_type:complete